MTKRTATVITTNVNRDIVENQTFDITATKLKNILIDIIDSVLFTQGLTTDAIDEGATNRYATLDAILDVLVPAITISGGGTATRNGDQLVITLPASGGGTFDLTANYDPTGTWNFEVNKLKVNNVNVATATDITGLQNMINALNIPANTDQLPEGNSNEYFTSSRARQAAPAETEATIRALIDATESNVNATQSTNDGTKIALNTQQYKAGTGIGFGQRDADGLIPINVTGTPSTPQPRITAFSIDGFDPANPPVAGASLGGNRTARFTIENAAQVQGNMTIGLQIGDGLESDVDSNVDPNDSDGVHIVNFARLTASAGQRYTYRLFGDDLDGDEFSRSFTIQIAAAHEQAYFGTFSTADNSVPRWSTVTLPTGEQVVDVQNENYSFMTRTSAMTHGLLLQPNHYLGIFVPTNREPTSIMDIAEALNAFTRVADARTIGNQNYLVFYQQNRGTRASNQLFTVSRRTT